jgi:hypothetical protein
MNATKQVPRLIALALLIGLVFFLATGCAARTATAQTKPEAGVTYVPSFVCGVPPGTPADKPSGHPVPAPANHPEINPQ